MKSAFTLKISAACLLFLLFHITSVNAQINEELARILQNRGMPGVEITTETPVGKGAHEPTGGISEEDNKMDAIMRNLLHHQSNQGKNDLHGLFGAPHENREHLPFAITVEEDEIWVEVLIKAESGYSGILKTTRAKNVLELGEIVTATIPVSLVDEIREHRMVEFIETSALREIHNYSGKASINADRVHSGDNLPRPYKGEGVVVGVIDSGIDFTHPDFSNESGTRIQYLLEFARDTYGEWDKQYIDENPGLVTQRDLDDGMGHGTHVTGTAAGGGRLNPALTGMAPESDIIFVKGMIESSFSDNNVINGCNYIFTRAAQLEKPAVINLSLGGLHGPLDGTSLYEQALSNMTGPGRIIVATTGNEGFSFRHAGANLQGGNRYATLLMPQNRTFAGANIWHKPGVISQVAVGAYSVDQTGNFEYLGNTDFVASGFSMNQQSFVHNGSTLGIVSIDARTTADPRNGDGNIFVAIQGTQQNIDIRNVVWVLIYDTAVAGRFDMWSLRSEFWPSQTGIEGAIEIPGDVLQTTGAPSTAKNIISVGSFVSTNSWTDIDNQPRQWTNPDPTRQSDNPVMPTIGQMSYFSSIGPTRDGRLAPDVTGPGELIFSALSSSLTEGVGLQRPMVLHSGGYQGMQGTSMAAPHVTGLVALMLEINPNLDYEDVVGILRQTARSDGFTGSLPNQKAGFGKVDAHAAVLRTLELSGIGTQPSTSLSYFDPQEEAEFLVLDSSLPVDSGFVFGTNRFFDTAKATAFTLPGGETSATVTEVNIWFGYKKDGLTNETYSIDIYNGNKESGPTGQPLASQTFLIRDINAGSTFNMDAAIATKHTFSEPVNVGAEFVVAVNFGDYGASGTGNVGIIGTKAVGQRVAEVWERWDNGSWHNMSDAWFGQSSAPGSGTNGWYMWKEAGLSTSVSLQPEITDLPREFRLDQNFPNPFNPATSIRYALNESADITLAVYDILGRQVALLENGFREAGVHTTRFDAINLSSGIYFYRLTAGSNSEIRKMMLMK